MSPRTPPPPPPPSRDLGIARAIAVLALPFSLIAPGGWLQAIVLAPLVLAASGYAIAAALFPPGAIAREERLVYTFVFSVSASAVGGVALQVVLGLGRAAWLLLLVGVVFGFCSIARRRRAATPVEDRVERGRLRPPAGVWWGIASVAAIALAGVAIAIASDGVRTQEENQSFASLWAVSAARTEAPTATRIGVWNHGGPATYKLELSRAGKPLRSLRLRLDPSQRWSRILAPEAATGTAPLLVTLYRGARSYRSVQLEGGEAPAKAAPAPAPGKAAPAPAPAGTGLYECRPKDPKATKPPPAPDLPPQVVATPTGVDASELPPLCPQGEVPQPTGISESPEALSRLIPTPGSEPQRARNGPLHYSHAVGFQKVGANRHLHGLWVMQTNEQPYIDYAESLAGAHSSAQLWAIDRRGPRCRSTAETGWSESAGLYGDVEPHLFVYAFDCGAPLGYAGATLPWVQTSAVAYPNMPLGHNDTFHVYGTRLRDGNWWVYYDGHWIGYVPHRAWKKHFPAAIDEAQAGGEVATPSRKTCTDMGFAGLLGINPGAASFGRVWYERGPDNRARSASLSRWNNDRGHYSTGSWEGGYPGAQFRYGGPGYCL